MSESYTMRFAGEETPEQLEDIKNEMPGMAVQVGSDLRMIGQRLLQQGLRNGNQADTDDLRRDSHTDDEKLSTYSELFPSSLVPFEDVIDLDRAIEQLPTANLSVHAKS
jgi:hypothetical protein